MMCKSIRHPAAAVLLAACSVAWTGEFVRAQSTQRVSVSSMGDPNNNNTRHSAISADGRIVAFWSQATNLVPDDTNSASDVFVHDVQTGITERVNVSSSGEQASAFTSSGEVISLSADGRYVAFDSNAPNLVLGDTNNRRDVFVHDRQTGVTERVSVSSAGEQGNQDSANPSISADGRYVAFQSNSTTLVPGFGGFTQIFVHDRQTGVTERASVGIGGASTNDSSGSPSISGDGRFVAFRSGASNLVPGDTNSSVDIFVYDRQMGETTRVNVTSSGDQTGGGALSVHISTDGRFVAFDTSVSDVVPGDTNGTFDVFVHDRDTGVTEMVSVSSMGVQGGASSFARGISADGRYVLVESDANNLVPDDTNGFRDVFLYDRQTGEMERVSLTNDGDQISNGGSECAVSDDGRFISFRASGEAVMDGGLPGIMLRDRIGADPCPWDLSGDGAVGSADLAIMLGCWGSVSPGDPCAVADLTDSGNIGSADLAVLLGNWGLCQ